MQKQIKWQKMQKCPVVKDEIISYFRTPEYYLQTPTFPDYFYQLEVFSVAVPGGAVVDAEVSEDGVLDDEGGDGPVIAPLGEDLVVEREVLSS